MSLSASLIASIVSAVIETVATQQPVTQTPTDYNYYVINRRIPPGVKYGYMYPPKGNGTVVINDKELRLSPVVRFRNLNNLVVTPAAIREPTDVLYVFNSYDTVYRVWLIDKDEAELVKASMSNESEAQTTITTTTTGSGLPEGATVRPAVPAQP